LDDSPLPWTAKQPKGFASLPLLHQPNFFALRQPKLLHFLVRRLLTAGIAKLLGLHSLCVLLFVFRRGVVAVFAITALQRDDLAHDLFPFLLPPFFLQDDPALAAWPLALAVYANNLFDDLRDGASADGVAAFANREAQTLL
jgi:hypothetical protein